jgi:hypothetical protein
MENLGGSIIVMNVTVNIIQIIIYRPRKGGVNFDRIGEEACMLLLLEGNIEDRVIIIYGKSSRYT